ncbi:hypothetical protein [Streptomyces malaysiensis]|uniref:Uncharacterized protein n=1 Tax=Streptomyces malaysiensis subsp. samsunensis TaxID=459658 RepID=A0A9X2LWC5_STRMQ|nr:hypothetical protein [Streptomyces samsunensis]MCQ8831785.1 hypothetical protein [Streptomyces samsunensis]
MAATTSRDQLLAEARRAWRAYVKSGTDEDYVAARAATTAARKAGISLDEIRDQ